MFETHPQEGGGLLSFDGVGDYVTIPIGKNISDQINTGIFTFDFWVKHDKNANGVETYFSLGESGTGGTSERFIIQKIDDGSSIAQLHAIIENGADFTYTGAQRTDLDSGEWHYIAFVSRGQAERQFYSAKTGATTLTAETANTTDHVQTITWDTIMLGRKIQGTTTYDGFSMLGQIDEFRMYSRALTAAELLKNYNGSKKRHTN